jgi:hypothetical protein
MYLCGTITTPDITMQHKDKDHVCSTPLSICLEVLGRIYRETFHQGSDPFAQNESLQVPHDGLPLGIVWIGEDL